LYHRKITGGAIAKAQSIAREWESCEAVNEREGQAANRSKFHIAQPEIALYRLLQNVDNIAIGKVQPPDNE